MAGPVLRDRADDAALRVTNIELFFDLVYVFAFTQLSDFLFEELTLRGALGALVMFVAVWQAWNYTAWATNWLDPARGSGALLMVVLIILSLVMAAAIPRATEGVGCPPCSYEYAATCGSSSSTRAPLAAAEASRSRSARTRWCSSR